MNSLRELIQHGEYELAAYRLIYGIVCASVTGSESDVAGDAGRAAGARPAVTVQEAGARDG